MAKRDECLLRAYQLTNVRVRQATDDEGPVIEGYAAVFDKVSCDLGGFREVIRPGAFSKTLQEGDPRATVNHNPDYVLGRKGSGSLSLDEDEHGLSVVITPPETQWARDFLVSMGRGDIDQMSFMFWPIKSDWVEGSAETDWLPLWVQREVDLLDVSVVTYPAYVETEAHLRSLGIKLWTPEPPALRSGERGDGHSDDDRDEGAQASGSDQGAALALRRMRLELIERTL